MENEHLNFVKVIDEVEAEIESQYMGGCIDWAGHMLASWPAEIASPGLSATAPTAPTKRATTAAKTIARITHLHGCLLTNLHDDRRRIDS